MYGGTTLKHHIDLTTPEIAALWKTYQQSTAVLCFLQHASQYVLDEEIKPIINEQIQTLTDDINRTVAIFTAENFPIPQGFSAVDVNLDAPALYTDLYILSFIYRYNQMGLPDYASILTKVGRQDIVAFFDEILKSATQLYLKALNLMFAKGIYDRPPKTSYPTQVNFIEKPDSFLAALLGNTRPLNVFELGESSRSLNEIILDYCSCKASFKSRKIQKLRNSLSKAKSWPNSKLKLSIKF
jgi:hypothetical protein